MQDALSHYLSLIAKSLNENRIYPQSARSMNQSGTVRIRLSIGDGPTPSFKLGASSGVESLDRAALTMMEKALASNRPPESLRGRDIEVMVPVRFDLVD